MKIRVEIPMLPPASASPNSRVHWSTRHRDSRTYHAQVRASVLDLFGVGMVPRAYTRRRLDLTFIFRVEQRRDEDNLRARFKAGLDALVQCGLLLDDDSRFLETGDLIILVDRDMAPLTIIELEDA